MVLRGSERVGWLRGTEGDQGLFCGIWSEKSKKYSYMSMIALLDSSSSINNTKEGVLMNLTRILSAGQLREPGIQHFEPVFQQSCNG